MPAEREFSAWADDLRRKHPEMFEDGKPERRRKARERWHPWFQRAYGIRPWEIGRYTLKEYNAMVSDLEKNGLGGL